jgi:ketosteroid isomerase-like protein
MSQENVEVVRRYVEAFNRADVEACVELSDPQTEADVSRAAGPYAGIYRGAEAIRGLLESYFEAWEPLRWEPRSFMEPEDGCVVMPFHASGRGKGSGIEVDAQAAAIWTVRDGKISRMQLFPTERAALEAVGLSE